MQPQTEKNKDSNSKDNAQQANKNSSYRQDGNPDRTKSDKDSGYDSESGFKKQASEASEDEQFETDWEKNPEKTEQRPEYQDSRDAYLRE